MGVEKPYIAKAIFTTNTCIAEHGGTVLDKVLFNEAYGTDIFFYSTESARKTGIESIQKRCKKKGITVEFKLLNPIKKEEAENN